MKQHFQPFDLTVIQVARGGHLPASTVFAVYHSEIAKLEALGGDFKDDIRSAMGGLVASEIELAAMLSAMLQHNKKRVRAAAERGLLQLAEAGVNLARYNLALQHLSGGYHTPDFQEAIRLLTAVAQTERSDRYLKGLALKCLGDCQLEGRGVATDAAKAHQIYEEAAELGVAEAAFNVGPFHDRKNANAHPGPGDFPKAAKFYAKALALGDVRGMTNLGLLYLAGRVLEPEAGYGCALLQRAAAHGDGVAVDAMVLLASSAVPTHARARRRNAR